MDNVYRLPTRYLNSTLADMALYHAVFYLLGRRRPDKKTVMSFLNTTNWSWRSENPADVWRRVESSTEQLIELTGVSKTAVNKFRNKLLQQGNDLYRILEEEGSEFVLHMPDYELAMRGRVVHIPTQFVEQGWLKWLCQKNASRFRLATVNLFFRQPKGKRLLALPKIRAKTKLKHRKTPPSIKQILDVISELDQVGLVTFADTETYQLNVARLAHPPLAIPNSFSQTIDDHPFVIRAMREDPARAKLAVECLQIGQFDLETTFDIIFRDLQYIQIDLERDRLLKKVGRSEKFLLKLSSPNRWREKWRGYRIALKRDLNREASPKIPISLDCEGEQTVTLQVDHTKRIRNGFYLHYAKVVLWIQDDFSTLSDGVELSLILNSANSAGLWKKYILNDDRELRADVTCAIRNGQQPLSVVVNNGQPLWDVALTICIEAYYLTR